MKLMENVFRRRLPIALALLLSIVVSPRAVAPIHAQESAAPVAAMAAGTPAITPAAFPYCLSHPGDKKNDRPSAIPFAIATAA